jgi:hypothetical protein
VPQVRAEHLVLDVAGRAYAIFTHPLLAEGLNTLFAMFDA